MSASVTLAGCRFKKHSFMFAEATTQIPASSMPSVASMHPIVFEPPLLYDSQCDLFFDTYCRGFLGGLLTIATQPSIRSSPGQTAIRPHAWATDAVAHLFELLFNNLLYRVLFGLPLILLMTISANSADGEPYGTYTLIRAMQKLKGGIFPPNKSGAGWSASLATPKAIK